MDSVSSFSSGMTNVIKDVLGLSVGILGYSWLVERVALIRIEAGWLTYVVGFLAVDFQGYWVHRWSHEINFLWNRHIIHHSSEEFNLSCALRQSISNIVGYFTFLLLPAALLGVPPEVIGTIAPLHLFFAVLVPHAPDRQVRVVGARYRNAFPPPRPSCHQP